MARFVLGITGASGAVIGLSMVKKLLMKGHDVHLVITKNGKDVLNFELEQSFDDLLDEIKTEKLHVESNEDFFSKIASGSFPIDAMVVAPCSMGTVGKIAAGTSDHLLIRAADVAIKEGRKLVLCVRETPMNAIHLENMLKLSKIGVVIMPICPLFYHKPKSIDEMVDDYIDRVLGLIGVKLKDKRVWDGK